MKTHRFPAVRIVACAIGLLGCGGDAADSGGSRPVTQAGTSAATPPPATTAGGPGVSRPASTGTAGNVSMPSSAGTSSPSAIAGSPAQPPPRTTPPPPPATTAGAPAMPAAGSGMPATPPPPPGPPGTWPAADPGKTGPFPTVTEMNVGPNMAYTMFRPKDLTQRHPVITWGNGTGTTPMVYRSMLNLYASHGFIVIASNSMNVAQGTPPPMLDGVTWVLEQDMMQGSALFQHVDRDRIGATGHSQGAIASTSAGADARIKTIAPIQILSRARTLHGPVLALCGAMDTTLPCTQNKSAYDAVANQPAMYAELKTANHMNWIFSAGGMTNPFHMITNAWFRVHLMNDTALRPMFYGECTLCKDTATWVTMRKMMDQ